VILKAALFSAGFNPVSTRFQHGFSTGFSADSISLRAVAGPCSAPQNLRKKQLFLNEKQRFAQ
jgi:hypothetical protein